MREFSYANFANQISVISVDKSAQSNTINIMLITNKNSTEEGLRKRTIGREIKVGPLSLSFVTIIVLAALCLFYLAQSTQSATNNYKVRELEDKKGQLEDDNKRLEVESIRLKSLNEIKKSTEDSQLEENKESHYLPEENSVTARR